MTAAAAPALAEIRVHPVKGLRGGLHRQARVERWGLAGDRRWMVVDPQGQFLTQREHAHMALIAARATEAGIALSAPGLEPLSVPIPGAGAETLRVRVWQDTVPAAAAGTEADGWISRAIGVPCRLVYLADPMARPVDPAFAGPGDTVNLADGFPVLLASLASLDDLNTRLAEPIPIGRFRPTLVVADAAAWAEDRWRRVRVGEVTFRVVKPCDRCIVTTIDPDTGTRPDKTEPLRALGRFRRDLRGGVMFGQNLIPEQAGLIAVGDRVEVLEAGAPNVMLAPQPEASLAGR